MDSNAKFIVIVHYSDKERSLDYVFNEGASIFYFSLEETAREVVEESVYPAAAFRAGENTSFVSSAGSL